MRCDVTAGCALNITLACWGLMSGITECTAPWAAMGCHGHSDKTAQDERVYDQTNGAMTVIMRTDLSAGVSFLPL